jgi:hypothetical protein
MVKTIRMGDIKSAYRARNPDGHWFDKDTMDFFRSQLPQNGFMCSDGTIFFGSSEKPPTGPRMHSVRRMDPAGEIDTVGEFMGYRTARGAGLEAGAAARAHEESLTA